MPLTRGERRDIHGLNGRSDESGYGSTRARGYHVEGSPFLGGE